MKTTTLKIALTIMIIVLFSALAQAQIKIGGGISYIKFLGEPYNNLGFGLNGEYGINEKTAVFVGFNKYLSSNQSYQAYAGLSTTGEGNLPYNVSVRIIDKVSAFNIYGGAKRYFFGTDLESGFGVYGLGEIGIMMLNQKTTVSPYDKSNYSLGIEDGKNETLTNFTLGLGLGANANLGFGSFYGEVGFKLPANEVNGQAVAVVVSPSVGFNVGVKISLDGSSSRGYKSHKSKKSHKSYKSKKSHKSHRSHYRR